MNIYYQMPSSLTPTWAPELLARAYYSDDSVVLVHGDCLDVLATLPDESVHAVVTDPPYALEFMGRKWDGWDSPAAFQQWCEVWARECLRVLKPGGHMLAFGGSRTWHRLASAVEDAGFEIRDSIAWLHGQGFPKGRNMGGDWDGWSTALKPAFEPVVCARKPPLGTVAANLSAHGTGALNIDGCRTAIAQAEREAIALFSGLRDAHDPNLPLVPVPVGGTGSEPLSELVPGTGGRWPANVLLDESQATELDNQTNPDSGASRFFPTFHYEAKASRSERPRVAASDGGDRSTSIAATFRTRRCNICGSRAMPGGYVQGDLRPWPSCGHGDWSMADPLPPDGNWVMHPTVKPLALMQWLIRLVTPPGGIVLEPFAGSGATLEACVAEGLSCIGIEREADYLPLIVSRLEKPIQIALDFRGAVTPSIGHTIAVGRFRPDGPIGYRACYPGAPERTTRAQAERDMCRHRQEQTR